MVEHFQISIGNLSCLTNIVRYLEVIRKNVLSVLQNEDTSERLQETATAPPLLTAHGSTHQEKVMYVVEGMRECT